MRLFAKRTEVIRHAGPYTSRILPGDETGSRPGDCEGTGWVLSLLADATEARIQLVLRRSLNC